MGCHAQAVVLIDTKYSFRAGAAQRNRRVFIWAHQDELLALCQYDALVTAPVDMRAAQLICVLTAKLSGQVSRAHDHFARDVRVSVHRDELLAGAECDI